MKRTKISLALSLTTLISSLSFSAFSSDSLTDALADSKAKVDMNLRYESVSQDNSLMDADALTLRTRLTLATGDYNNFSGLIEFEDSRQVFGINDYNDAVGNNPDYSVIADPETTELDQAFIQYKNKNMTAKAGRQVITYDNHRYVGHVGWRQDRQTFDAFTFGYSLNKALSVDYGYITKRNRIFAEAKDIDSNDHLINASYKSSLGKLTGYGYLLEVDDGTSNGIDTFGVRFAGNVDINSAKFSINLEYATQDADSNNNSFSADYMMAEVNTQLFGLQTKVGYEVLGSDNAMYGFSTPLATLHMFNGWSDQFLTTPKEGLEDLYVSLSGKIFKGKWSLIYHDFNANETTPTVNDLGSEIDAVYSRGFTKTLSGGVKYAAYSAGDVGAGKVDTDKLWLWLTFKF